MMSNLDASVTRLCDFLGVKLSEADKKCVMDNNEGYFHRKYTSGDNPMNKVTIDQSDLSGKVTEIQHKIQECLNSSWRCSTSGSNSL